jgi:predicted nucleic acid-binding protein
VIVVDASAVLELLLNTPVGQTVAERITAAGHGLHAPHLVDVEIAQALRRYAREGKLALTEAAEAIDDLHDLDLNRHAHEPLLDRIWQLRENFSAYDAAYIALAEALDAVLLTCDARLARAPGAAHRVELVARS